MVVVDGEIVREMSEPRLKLFIVREYTIVGDGPAGSRVCHNISKYHCQLEVMQIGKAGIRRDAYARVGNILHGEHRIKMTVWDRHWATEQEGLPPTNNEIAIT